MIYAIDYSSKNVVRVTAFPLIINTRLSHHAILVSIPASHRKTLQFFSRNMSTTGIIPCPISRIDRAVGSRWSQFPHVFLDAKSNNSPAALLA